jgi:DNA replication protein DnaD
MYYRLINHQIDMNYNYNIYFNLQNVHEHKKAAQLRQFLKTDYSKIRTIQPIHAFESVFMQLTDFFAGALNYHFRGLNQMTAKCKLIKKIQKLAGSELMPPAEKQADSLNLFFMDLNLEP